MGFFYALLSHDIGKFIPIMIIRGYKLILQNMAFLKKRASGYFIGFKKTVNGKQQVKIISLKTKRALIAKRLKLKIEAAYEV